MVVISTKAIPIHYHTKYLTGYSYSVPTATATVAPYIPQRVNSKTVDSQKSAVSIVSAVS